MKRPKGPQLKKPELKAPDFLVDLYYDLRDRRLLPLIALVLVAIVATPFLLGRQAETTSLPVTPPAIQALKDASGSEASATLTVVEAQPGLRDYRKRLRGREPLDPFRSLGKPSLKGARLGKGAGKSSSSKSSFTSTSTTVKKTKTKEGTKTTETTTTTTGSGDGAKQDGKGGGGDAKGDGKDGGKTSIYTIDVQISIGGQAGATAKPSQRLDVEPLTPLPGDETPVVTYLGANPEGNRAVFTVSRDVTSVYGEVKCVAGTDTCEVLELEPGFPVTFVYGPDQTRYRIKLLNQPKLQ